MTTRTLDHAPVVTVPADLITILSYRRAPMTDSHDEFLAKVIEPVFGKAVDRINQNYVLRIGDAPDTAFVAHHDTVEVASGRNRLARDSGGMVFLHPDEKGSSCLGADDGAGLWMLLQLIKARRPGVYILFGFEESGCVGSFALDPEYLTGVTKVIGFDRPGTAEVVTHMCGKRVCSNEFATALAKHLGLNPSNAGGMSDPYALKVALPHLEATNVAIGYRGHHTVTEYLDVPYLLALRDRMLTLDTATLPIGPVEPDVDLWGDDWDLGDPYSRYSYTYPKVGKKKKKSRLTLDHLCTDYPEVAARLMESCGIDVADFLDALREMGL